MVLTIPKEACGCLLLGDDCRRKVGIRQIERQVNTNVAVSTHKGCHGEGSPGQKYFGDDFPVNRWADSKFSIEV